MTNTIIEMSEIEYSFNKKPQMNPNTQTQKKVNQNDNLIFKKEWK